MQNKPNPQTIKTNLNTFTAKTYNNKPPRPPRKNKPNSNPIPTYPKSPIQIMRSPRPRKSILSLLPSVFSLSSAKTQKNHDPFVQNKPNPKNTKTNLTPYPKKNYAKISALRPQKNKPNSNPIQPNPPAQIEKTNPIQTQFLTRPKPPLFPIAHSPNQTQSSRETTDKPQATTCRPRQLLAAQIKAFLGDYRITLINMQTIEYRAHNNSERSFICVLVPSWQEELELLLNFSIYCNGVSEDG